MPIGETGNWHTLERISPQLFLVGFVLELAFAAVHGAAYLVEGFSFIQWLYPTVILGRLAVLLGLAGMTARLARGGYDRVKTASRVILALAIVSTTGLMTLSTLIQFGVETQVIAVFGMSTVLLTLLTLTLFGVVGVATDAYPTVIGVLLLISTAAVLFVLFGQGTFSVDFRGAVGEGVNAAVFLAIWHLLSTESEARSPRGPAADAMAE